MDSFSITKLQKLEPDMNSFNNSSKDKKYSENKKYNNERETVLKIYAELSKRDYSLILNDELEICLPMGVQMSNREGSRELSFECIDEDTKKILIDGLEASGIPWQEN